MVELVQRYGEQLENGMEGSPVRGPERSPLSRLNEARSLEGFQAELIRIISSELHHGEVFAGLYDTAARNLQIPTWVKSHLERHPSLYQKLQQGEMAGISHTEENPVLRPASATRSSVVLIPLIASNALQGIVGLVSSLDGPQLSVEEIEGIRQLAYEVSPILSRLQEIESLRQENKTLKNTAGRTSDVEDNLAATIEERNALNAVLQMHSHLQANVAHELRTPLAAIRGYTRMILDGRGGEINATQRDYLRIVTENTNRLIGLVSWMSYVAELTSQHLSISTFDLRDVWKECLDSAAKDLAAKSIELTAQIPDEPFPVVGDREKLAYVLTEFIGAAARFSNAPGKILAEFSHGRDKEVSVKITEKGGTIPPDALSRIFERSFNAISKPAAQQVQTEGISLSGVYDVIGMHGGRVFVNSTAGQGTTFLFTLPAVSMGGEESSHEQAVNSGRRRR
ncbi:MAG TPA: HAMP domain-containing sensor histidine kinase [Terriglobia bacterium]|nr:HAMP domain-containing sensor histidine kinase [Terriglobia bacterium]